MSATAPEKNANPPAKVLFVRLSALGDLVLAASALEYLPARSQIDWVVSSQFAELLQSNPRIQKLWRFDRKLGLRGWLRLGRELYDQDYSAVFDLHSTLRSRLLRLQFALLDLLSGRRNRPVKRVMRSLPKERWRLLGYFAFKKFWPKAWRPRHILARVGEVMLGAEPAFPKMPQLKYLSVGTLPTGTPENKQYYALMPSSKWSGKEWSAEKFRDLIEMVPASAGIPVVLGTNRDKNSLRLVELLKNADIDHVSGLGKWKLAESARILAGARFLVAVDTGFAHIAQALEVPTLVIFGPTTPEMGFGPWAPRARSAGIELACRPCGKDGRVCQRIWQPYQCLRALPVNTVFSALREITSLEGRGFPKV